MKSDIIAICSSDYHLTHTPPVWRSNEPDWYEAMKRPIDEIAELQTKYECPILFAGDLFDKWYGAAGKSATTLINWTINTIPGNILGVPGQHDLPEHNINEADKSAFTSVLLAGNMEFTTAYYEKGMYIDFYPWGSPLEKKDSMSGKVDLKVAVIHEYMWKKGFSYPGSPKEKELCRDNTHNKIWGGKYYGYDVIIVGDNHKPFEIQIGKTLIFNCGPIMRRAKDEENLRPRVGLLHRNGSITTHYLSISKDRHLEGDINEKPSEYKPDFSEFANELAKLGASALDFASAWKRYSQTNHLKKDIDQIVQKAMEDEKSD